jgi:ribosomal subunit interface protein
MKLAINGRHIDTGDAFRQHASDSLSATLDKYFNAAMEANVTLSREAHLYRAAVSVHVGRGLLLQANGQADAVYLAFDSAVERLSKQLRRYKRRLRDHHGKLVDDVEPLLAQQYILAGTTDPEEDETEPLDGGLPAVVAEMETEVPRLTVSDAVMRMDLSDQPAVLFRNRAHGGLNMVYRRSDGNIGWVDPRGNRGK